MSEAALPAADIPAARALAERLYDEGIIGYRKLKSWMERLDYQESVGHQIDVSLATAEILDTEMPLGREREQVEVTRHHNRRASRVVGKFARSL